VDDALLVQELDRSQHNPPHQLGLLFEGEPARALVSGAPLQVLLDDEVRRLVVGTEAVNAGDVGVAGRAMRALRP